MKGLFKKLIGNYICIQQINKILSHNEYQMFTEHLLCAGEGKH